MEIGKQIQKIRRENGLCKYSGSVVEKGVRIYKNT